MATTAAKLTGDEADEMRIVVAGARADLGQFEQAITVLSTPQLDPARTGTILPGCLRVRRDAAGSGSPRRGLQWFLHAAEADVEGATDAEDRVSELG